MKNYLFITLFFSLAFTNMARAQSAVKDTAEYPYWVQMMQDEKANFFDVQKAFNKFYDAHHDADGEEKAEKKGEEEQYGFELYRRWEYMMRRRINPDGSRRPADQAYKEFIKYTSNNLNKIKNRGGAILPGTNPTGNWTALGPTTMPNNSISQPNGAGRINAIAFHPTNTGTIWVGAPSGGLWVTTDSGKTWTAKTDGLATLGVSAIAINPKTASTMYIGTGDRDHYDAPGIGVLKSTNSGSTWSSASSGMGSVTVSKLLINPNNTSILIAATSGGIYRSTNSGGTWSQTSSNSNFYKDMVFKPHNPNIMYAEENGSFYRSKNNGASWTKITSGLSSAYRGVIAVTPADTDRVYFITTSTFTFSACYTSTDAGVTFRTKSTSPNIMDYADNGSGSGGQAFYDLCTIADTANPGIIYVGGINIFKSKDSGANWTCIAHWVGAGLPEVHADQHVFAINPLNNRLYVGCDGGIYYSSNNGSTWKEISSGLNIGQIYKIGQSATRSDMMLAGFQDNGTAQLNKSKWNSVIGGDGMECIVDPVDTNNQYGEVYYGNIYQSDDAGQTFYNWLAGNGTNNITESGDWVTPYILSKSNHRMMFAGYHNIWRCDDVLASSPSWTQISNNLASTNAYLVEVTEQSAADSNVFYFSRTDNTLFLSTDVTSSSPSWTDLTSNLPNSNDLVSEIKTDPKNPNVVYIIQNGNIYVSVNKGGKWSKITGTLPSIIKNTIVIDKNSNSGLYLGTEAGVYYRDSTMSDWTPFYNGLPAAAQITELEIYYDASKSSNNKLKAASFGRGAWQSDLYSPVTPVAAFSVNNSAQCLTGNSFAFSDSTKITSGSIIAWSWDYGDGSLKGTTQNPKHTYTKAGTFTVKLIATSSLGTSDNASTIVTVYPQASPTFAINNSGQCLSGNSFTFTDKTTISSGSISTWAWNFGDLGNSGSQSPTHAYGTAASFKVQLKTTTNNGCTDTISKYVSVYPMPTAAFNINNSSQCQNGNSFVFTDKSSVTGSTFASWAWDFGDLGTSGSQSPTHVYASNNTFTVKLIATTANGCVDNTSKTVTVLPSPVSIFSVNSSAQCLTGNSFSFTDKSTISSGSIASWTWDFGDLSTTTKQNPTYPYGSAGTYRVKLKVTSSAGCTDTTSKTVIVLPKPAAAFSINNTAQCNTGNSFLFADKTTIASGSISTWAWDFGDLNTGSNQNVSHTYSLPGNYTVKLKVTSNGGCTDTISKIVTVYPSPVAAFGINNASQCPSGNSFVFTDKTTVSSGSIKTWAWDFGDLKSSSSQSPTHSYASSGSYSVKLTVTTNNGCTDTISKIVVVNPQPSASFTVNTSAQCLAGNSFVFSDKSSITGGSLSAWSWDFGDATGAAISTPTHSYTGSANFIVKLKITSNSGCTDSFSKNMAVFPQPVAAFKVNADSQCLAANNFVLTDKTTLSSGIISSWSWDYGDGSFGATQNPSHTYKSAGNFTIKLKVTTNNSCTDTVSIPVKVFPQPVAIIGVNNTAQCFAVNNFVFTDKSTVSSGSITNWLWYFGNGDTASAPNPVYIYPKAGTYTVSLKVTTNNGCTDSVTKTVNVYPKPAADFTISSAEQCLPGNSFSFTDNSNVSSGKIGSWKWNFGDGINGSSQTLVHVYAKGGVYQVKLKSISDNNCPDSISKMVKVDALPSPVIKGDTAVCARLNALYFTKNDSGSTYKWKVIGGSIVSGSGTDSIVINWPKFTGGTIWVTETNAIGCADSANMSVFVMPVPAAKFGVAGTICSGNPVQFQDSSAGSGTFLYDFADGDTSTQRKPFHTFIKGGNYNVKLLVTNSSGCTDSTYRMIKVKVTPDAHWKLTYSGSNAVFHALDSNYNDSAYHWTFGDGNNGTGHSVSHLYPKNTSYTVKLSIPYIGCGNNFDTTVDISKSVIERFENKEIKLSIYPNPFHENTVLDYQLIDYTNVKIAISDITGKEVGVVWQGKQVPGKYSFEINAGRYKLNPGVYFVKIQLNDMVVSRHVVKF